MHNKHKTFKENVNSYVCICAHRKFHSGYFLCCKNPDQCFLARNNSVGSIGYCTLQYGITLNKLTLSKVLTLVKSRQINKMPHLIFLHQGCLEKILLSQNEMQQSFTL